MAHPMKGDAASAHTAKMRRMTDGYGAADPKANILSPDDVLKGEGPQPSQGFGEGAPAKGRSDRAKRMVANPVATYAKGGKVKRRADGGSADVSSIEQANRDQAASTPGRARGGRMKHKTGTHVNVIVAPQGSAGAGAGMGVPPPVVPLNGPPGGAPMMPPKPPMMPPGGGMPPMGAMPPGAGAMPPPGLPVRAKGGRVHEDEAQDKALILKTLRDQGLTRADHEVKRARGGSVRSFKDMDAGSMSGEGRQQKAEIESHKTRKPQAV